MKPFLRLWIVALAATAAAPQETPAPGSPEAKRSDELQALLRKLRETRQAYYARRSARDGELDAARQPVRRLETEIAELKARGEETDRSLADLKAELATLAAEEKAAAAARAALVPELESVVAAAAKAVEGGIDYRKADRLARLGAKAESSAAVRVGRLWGFVQEELRIARSGEAYTAEIPLEGGRVKPARVFRVGHLLLGYVTEDGLEAGRWTSSGWRKAPGPDVERALRGAVEMLDRRRPPSLLRLPASTEAGP
jgi:hypothetical protein